jgi:hypothetical protein
MPNKNDGGPAFPVIGGHSQSFGPFGETDNLTIGMSLRAYAAINLKQPDSGIDWLDKMIADAKKDELAAKAMQGIVSVHNHYGEWTGCGDMEMNKNMAGTAYSIADAMLKAREE